MSGDARSLARGFASYGAAILLLWVFFRNTEWRTVVESSRSVGWVLLGGAVAIRLLSLLVASVRWQLLLAPVRRVPLSAVVLVMMMGTAITTVAPMQAAEVVRPYLLSRRETLDFNATFATVVVEWMLDALGVAALVMPALLWVSMASGRVGAATSPLGRVIVLVAAFGLAGIGALRSMPRGLARLTAWAHRPVGRHDALRAGLARRCERFADGLRVLERRRSLVAVAACSVIVAALTAVSAWMVLVACGLPISFVAGFIVLGLVTVGGMIPTPGAIGGFHEVCQLGLLGFFGVDRARTVLPVIALHAVLYLPAAAIGALCFLSIRTRGGER